MASFVLLSVKSLCKLLELIHKCPEGVEPIVVMPEVDGFISLLEGAHTLSFVCCGEKITFRNILVLNPSEMPEPWKDRLWLSDAEERKQELQLQNYKVEKIEVRISTKNGIEVESIKHEEPIRTFDIPGSPSSICVYENDPLALEEENSTSCNVSVEGQCSEIAVPKILRVSDLGIERDNENSGSNNIPMFSVGVKRNDSRSHLPNIQKQQIVKRPVGRRRSYPDSFTCEFCGKLFVGKDRAYQFCYHRNKDHTQEMAYNCCICSKKFWGERELAAHMAFHRKPVHICHVCGQKFSMKKNLKAHILVHSDKKCICQFCNKKFRRKDHLKIHERIHTGSHPYMCQKCGTGYPQNVQLKLHMKQCLGLKGQGRVNTSDET